MSMVQLSQVGGIAYYEFRMLWRERGLLVITLAVVAMVLLASLIASTEIVGQSTSSLEILLQGQLNIAQLVVFMTWSPVGATLALIAPVFMADIIPKDQQIGVRELLDTLPISRGIYLVGKLLGAWLALFSSLAIVVIVVPIFWFLRVGAFDLRPYLEMWLFGGVSLVVINTGISIFLAAGQPSRRRAIILIVLIVVAFLFVGNLNLEKDTLGPVRGPIILYFLDLDVEVSAQLFWQTIAVGLAELVVIGAAVWGWMRWQEARR